MLKKKHFELNDLVKAFQSHSRNFYDNPCKIKQLYLIHFLLFPIFAITIKRDTNLIINRLLL